MSSLNSYGYHATNSSGYATAVSIFVLVIAFLDIPNYLGAFTDGEFLPKNIYLLVVALIVPLILSRRNAYSIYLGSPYSQWIFVALSLNIFHLIYNIAVGNLNGAAITGTRIQFIVLAQLVGFLLSLSRAYSIAMTCFICAVFLSALQVVDFILPGLILPSGTLGVVLGRAGSTLINANKAAESLVLLAIFGMAAIRPDRRVWFLLLVLPGVFLSFSRAGFLAYVLVLLIGFWLKIFSRKSYLVLVIALISFGVIASSIVGYILSTVDSGAIDNIQDRLGFLSTLNISDASAQDRLGVAEAAVDSTLSSPIFGNGAGFTHLWSVSDQAPHNQHLLMLSEYGLFGYLIFCWLLVIIYKGRGIFHKLGAPSLARLAFFVVFAFTPFTHNMLDNFYWFVALFLLAQRDSQVSP